MKVAFVLPRYGTAIIGGAETAARLFAEHLVSEQGWTVEVLTTCAKDFTTWEEVYPAGTETINGVRVERMAAEAGRDPSFHPFSAALLADPRRATLADAERWIDLQGPKAPARSSKGHFGDGRCRRLLSLPLLPDGARHRTHPCTRGAAPGCP